VKAPFRVIPPSTAQRAADPEAPAVVLFDGAAHSAVLADTADRLGLFVDPNRSRIVASLAELARLALALQTVQTQGAAVPAAALQRFLQPAPAWKLRTLALPLDRPHIMGILNLTVDSFSGDGVGHSATAALRRAEALRSAGAILIDVGAETARADRPAMDEETEAGLVGPVVAELTREGHCVSVDTYKPTVAAKALDAGAEVVNDISGLTLGKGAAAEAAKAGAGYVLNYSYTVPKRRPDPPPMYGDIVAETVDWMFERVTALRGLGMPEGSIAIDPGIAFGKSHDEDIQVLRRLGEFTTLGLPILLAHSRKNFIGSVTGRPPRDRDFETHVATALAFEQGARIFRVHDPVGAARALEIAAAIAGGHAGTFAPDSQSWPWRTGASAPHMTTALPDRTAPPGQRW
jgi:dihydropteroate synthase